MNSLHDSYHAVVSGRARGVGSSVARVGLRLASVPYAWAMRGRNCGYDRGWFTSHRAGVPVISVGNLTLGGTGKTPCVEYVAGFYRNLNVRVAILSRGYGNTGGRNDEAFVLEENLPDVPHLQSGDRVALARTAIEDLQSELLVLDDGFQHRRLARDRDLVLIDATEPWGHGWTTPGGLLREPISGLRRADAVVLTRCDLVSADELYRLRTEVGRFAPGKPLALTRHRPLHLRNSEGQTLPLTDARDRPIAAFCGLGNPTAFRRSLDAIGLTPSAFRTYPDHHAYNTADIDDLGTWADGLATDCLVLTTQKDLVKLRVAQLGGRAVWAVRICLQFNDGQDALDHLLKEALP